MKKSYYNLIAILALLFCVMAGAQSTPKNHINYQGVARDSENNLMEQKAITVGIALKFGNAGTATVYEENHSVTTDANGVFSLKIGNGSPISGSFDNLPWGDATFMTVSLNGVEIGTTELAAVPYAIASGDKQWEENGSDIENKNEGEVGIKNNFKVKGGFNLSKGNQVNEISDDGSLAENSNGILPTQRAVKTYVDNKVFGGSGGAQTAAEVPYDNTTSGLAATDAQAAIDELVAGGEGADADADPTNEFQNLSLAGTTLQISDGTDVDLAPIIPPGGTDDQGLVLAGDILTIEDGTGSVDLSAYGDDADADPNNEVDVTAQTGILLGDGTAVTGLVGTADGDVAKWDAVANKWKAAADEVGGGGSGTPSGLEALDEGNGIGWRLIGKDPNDYGSIGLNAVDLSHYEENLTNGGATGSYAVASGWNTRALGDWSTATGRQTAAEGDGSFAVGWQNMALGDYSVVMGRETIASGSRSVAMGMETSATNIAAFSMGNGTYASGRYSAAMGINTRSDAQGSFAVGKFNAGGGDPDNWVETDPIFEIGIGGNVSSRANAMTVLKNGNVGVGEAVPDAKMHVDGNIRSTDLAGAGERNVVADASGNLIIGAGGGGNSPWLQRGGSVFRATGNVGIGTTNPESRLHVAGHTRVDEGMSVEGGMFVQTNSQSFQLGSPGNGDRWFLATGTNNGSLDFLSRTSGGGLIKTNFRMEHTGEFKVGGIIQNKAWLHVRKNSTVSKPQLKLEEVGDDYARLELKNNQSSAFWHIAGIAKDGGSGAFNSRLNFFFKNDRETANRMTIKGGGNVGIGTADPSAKLDVAGNIRTSGEFHTTGTGAANMAPIAYGNIRANGTVRANSNNVSLNKLGPGYYRIGITGESINNSSYIVMVTKKNRVPGFISASAEGGRLFVFINNTSGLAVDSPFDFVIYKP